MNRISKYKFWKEGNHAVVLDSNKLKEEKLNYIHHNPVEALIVSEPQDYIFSSAKNYSSGNGLLKCSLLV